ncbi:MAG: phage tail tape measure protein, partial [Clostridiales bacterium]|nr:phage tail tape measure protein [Clostridiales bacterium]
MDQVFRIEIPVEAVNKTDVASLQKLESELDKLASKAEKVKAGMSGIKESAQQAGNQAKQGMNAAGQSVDKFTQRIEKSQKTLRGMFKEKLKLIIEALDKASPVIKSLWTSLRGMAGKAWHVAVRMTDFITAPFRKLYNMITSPITLALSVAGIGMGAGDLVTTFKDFSTGMSAVKALTSASDVEFQKLTPTAKDLRATTVFSASETSMGMQYLAMSGWDTNQILAAMPGLLDLAAAGATDLAVASDIVANVMNAMGMAAEQAGHAADIFAKTATSSNTTIEYLGETLKYAAPIAHSFGSSLEEVSAVAGMMANAGIKGSMAGTAIRSSLLSMATPTAEAAKLMNSLGLSFSNADGSMKGMSEIVRNLQTAFSTLTEAQRLQYT